MARRLFSETPFVERDPASLDQPVQRRIQRSLLDLQHVFRSALDGFGNRMPVRRPGPQRLQDQQVERALQELDAPGLVVW